MGGFTEHSKPYWEPHMDKFELVSAPDKYTVVFKQKKVDPTYLMTAIMQSVNFIYAPDVIKQHGDAKDWRNLVGTGPFMLTDYVEGSSLTFEKNPNYWGFDEKYPENRLPYVDKIIS